jgi:crotonobetainyl-CoA:carnitine CoA-transferase CaiB-like acyl-CoA transferase
MPDGPPVRTGIATTDYLAGLYAFSGILLALRHRDRSGKGQHVDIALYDAILSTLSMPAGVLQSTGQEPMRLGNDHSSIAPYEVFACADGTLMVAAANGRLWKQLCAAIGRSDLTDDDRFRTNTDRVKNRGAETRARQAFRVTRSTRWSSGSPAGVRVGACAPSRSAGGSAGRAAADADRIR